MSNRKSPTKSDLFCVLYEILTKKDRKLISKVIELTPRDNEEAVKSTFNLMGTLERQGWLWKKKRDWTESNLNLLIERIKDIPQLSEATKYFLNYRDGLPLRQPRAISVSKPKTSRKLQELLDSLKRIDNMINDYSELNVYFEHKIIEPFKSKLEEFENTCKEKTKHLEN